jgi:hypothetical protein
MPSTASAPARRKAVWSKGSGKPWRRQVFPKKIDAADQTAKDVEKRLIPMLKAIKALPEDIAQFEKIHLALAGVEKGPIAASRQLKLLTGCDSISEISTLVSNKFVGAGKLGNLPAK